LRLPRVGCTAEQNMHDTIVVADSLQRIIHLGSALFSFLCTSLIFLFCWKNKDELMTSVYDHVSYNFKFFFGALPLPWAWLQQGLKSEEGLLGEHFHHTLIMLSHCYFHAITSFLPY